MQNFFAFFMLIPAPLGLIAMIENTTMQNFWYHVGTLAFFFISAFVWSFAKDAMERY